MHRLIDFKSFADVSVNLFRPMTVLIGPNGSGKTNLIEAVELLAFLASGVINAIRQQLRGVSTTSFSACTPNPVPRCWTRGCCPTAPCALSRS